MYVFVEMWIFSTHYFAPLWTPVWLLITYLHQLQGHFWCDVYALLETITSFCTLSFTQKLSCLLTVNFTTSEENRVILHLFQLKQFGNFINMKSFDNKSTTCFQIMSHAFELCITLPPSAHNVFYVVDILNYFRLAKDAKGDHWVPKQILFTCRLDLLI